jgi:tRNA-splicing ligase RtcB
MGVFVMAKTSSGLAEEMPAAYKDVTDVIKVTEMSGISKRIAKFKPIGVIKG